MSRREGERRGQKRAGMQAPRAGRARSSARHTVAAAAAGGRGGTELEEEVDERKQPAPELRDCSRSRRSGHEAAAVERGRGAAAPAAGRWCRVVARRVVSSDALARSPARDDRGRREGGSASACTAKAEDTRPPDGDRRRRLAHRFRCSACGARMQRHGALPHARSVRACARFPPSRPEFFSPHLRRTRPTGAPVGEAEWAPLGPTHGKSLTKLAFLRRALSPLISAHLRRGGGKRVSSTPILGFEPEE